VQTRKEKLRRRKVRKTRSKRGDKSSGAFKCAARSYNYLLRRHLSEQRMRLFSRRRAILSAATSFAGPKRPNTTKPNAELVALGSDFDAVAAQLDNGPSLDLDLAKEFDRLEKEILARSATTLKGLFVKAKIGCWVLLGDFEPTLQSSTLDQVALSIMRDLIRLHRPD
jgi:hypothetical protein